MRGEKLDPGHETGGRGRGRAMKETHPHGQRKQTEQKPRRTRQGRTTAYDWGKHGGGPRARAGRRGYRHGWLLSAVASDHTPASPPARCARNHLAICRLPTQPRLQVCHLHLDWHGLQPLNHTTIVYCFQVLYKQRSMELLDMVSAIPSPSRFYLLETDAESKKKTQKMTNIEPATGLSEILFRHLP